MVSIEEKEIDGTTYKVSQLTASDGRKMLILLSKVIGPSLGRLIDSNPNTVGESIAGAVYELVSAISDDKLKHVCDVFGKHTTITHDGKARRLDLNFQELFFAGSYASMFKWLAFCIEVNYRDFIESLTNASNNLVNESDGKNPMVSKLKPLLSQNPLMRNGISGE